MKRFGAVFKEVYMNKVLNYLLKTVKSKSTYFLAATVVLNVAALILYVNTGVSVFIPELSSAVIVFMVLGIILPFAAAFSPLKITCVVLYVINLFACLRYLASQASFIANVFVGIDGSTFPAAFYLIVIFTLASAVLSLVAMHFVKETRINVAAETAAEGGVQ